MPKNDAFDLLATITPAKPTQQITQSARQWKDHRSRAC
jgi:hypothetical protein